jgi:polar amino acid transport system substrate-binding protein
LRTRARTSPLPGRFRLLPLLLVLTLGLAACPEEGDDAGDTAADDADTGELDLVQDGQLTVCSDIPYPPFEFVDDAGEYAGFDIDVMREIATGLDLELNVRETPWDGIFASLETGDCDVVASAVTITEERRQQMDFSDPYFEADQSLLIRAEDAETYTALEDLEGQTIGVQTGTTGADYAEENLPEGASIVEYDGAGEMFAAMETRDVEALLQDFGINADRAAQDDAFEVTKTFPTGEEYGFAVRQGNDPLLEAINGELERIRDEGTYDEIHEEYFGTTPDDDVADTPDEEEIEGTDADLDEGDGATDGTDDGGTDDTDTDGDE